MTSFSSGPLHFCQQKHSSSLIAVYASFTFVNISHKQFVYSLQNKRIVIFTGYTTFENCYFFQEDIKWLKEDNLLDIVESLESLIRSCSKPKFFASVLGIDLND